MIPAEISPALQQAARLLGDARHAVALTGAGISTPSGVPDFRSHNTGLWSRSDPMKVASLTSFRHTPGAFFDWLRPLLKQISSARPNPAHLALADLEKAGILKATITQNIDNLHQQAGSGTVLEVHGSLTSARCLSCRRNYATADFLDPFLRDGTLPRCPTCQALLKPNIVLFEEMLPAETWEMAQAHCEEADVLLVAGSSLTVMPAASLPQYTLERGGALVINNLTPTYLDGRAAALLPLDAATALPQIRDILLH